MAFRTTAARALAVLALAAAACAGCQSLSVRPRFEAWESKVDFSGPISSDRDVDQQRTGVELAGKMCPFAELYADLSSAEFDVDSPGTPTGDGWAAGVGFRALIPEGEGWHPDFGGRVGYHRLNEDVPAGGAGAKWDWKAWEADLNLGAQYGIRAGEGVIVAPRAGGYFKWQWGRMSAKLAGVGGIEHTGYELESFGAYAGARVYFPGRPGFELGGEVFGGTESLAGAALFGGIRF